MGCLYVCERSLVVCLVYELTDAGEGLMKNDVVEHTTDIMCCDVFCLRIDLHVCTKGTGYNMISRKVIRYQCEDEEEVELSFNGTRTSTPTVSLSPLATTCHRQIRVIDNQIKILHTNYKNSA